MTYEKNKALKDIEEINKNITTSLSLVNTRNRGFTSQNILSQLRNLSEAILVFCYNEHTNQNVAIGHDSIHASQEHLVSIDKYNDICKLHKWLQEIASHYTQNKVDSQSLMIKYCEILIRIKQFMHNEFSIEILQNISRFPIDIDPKYKEYYKKILLKIREIRVMPYDRVFPNKYYIIEKKSIILGEEIMYEMVLTLANDRISKLDRMIAFTTLDIMQNYACDLKIVKTKIKVFGKDMPISIIVDSRCSIRPCEFKNLGKVFGYEFNLTRQHTEYRKLMQYLTEHKINLLDLILLNSRQYKIITDEMTKNVETKHIIHVLNKCRDIIITKRDGTNILRYFLYRMNNKVIKNQLQCIPNSNISNLYLTNSALPFDNLPFTFSLKRHNARLDDLLYSIPLENRESDFLARNIIINTEKEHKIYTDISEINFVNDIDKCIEEYNSKLWYGHKRSGIRKYRKYLYIEDYEKQCDSIIERLINLSNSQSSLSSKDNLETWIANNEIDDIEKINVLKRIFNESRVHMIYGAAGTGKTTLIDYISRYYNEKKKLYLTNTNSALENLKSRIDAINCEFSTIAKGKRKEDETYDIVFIDECSTVSNRDMYSILKNIKYNSLVLVGDNFQIEAISFGNWFDLARGFVKKSCFDELTKPFRTNDECLLDFWNSLRELDEDCIEKMIAYKYTSEINDSLLEKSYEDEIILCLSYDGLYGVNNINRFLQEKNPNPSVSLGINEYKVGDPILFNDSQRFVPYIYNNMKGIIRNIRQNDKRYIFQVELDRLIDRDQIFSNMGLVYVKDTADKHTVVEFSVDKNTNYDDDNDSLDSVIPFQVAYAVSIHKAQGLEYESVKIVIPSDLGNRFSHNIFYTAVTRSKKYLKVYSSPETLNNIFSNLKIEKPNDVFILAGKYKLKYKRRK